MSAALHLDSGPRTTASPSALSFSNALDESTLPGRARRIGGILARRAYLPGRQGSCQVTVGWLAEQAGCGRSTVRAAIDELQAAGLVEVVYQLDPARGPGGKPHHAPNLYRLRPERLRSVQRPRLARTYLPELGNVSDDPHAVPEPPPPGARQRVQAVEDPPPTAGGGSLSPAQEPPPAVEDKETSPRENKEKGEGSPLQRCEGDGPREAPSQPSRPTAAWLLERYRSAYALHYQRPPVVMAHDRAHAAEVLTVAREQAQHHQQRLAHQGCEAQALDDLTEQCVNAWLTRYLARPGRITKDHPEGYLRGQGHPLRWLGGELAQLGSPWDGSRTTGQPPRVGQEAARGEASTVDPSQALTTSVLAQVRRRSEENAARAARKAAREAANGSPNCYHAPAADELAASEPVALEPTAETSPPGSEPATNPCSDFVDLTPAPIVVEEADGLVAVAGSKPVDLPALEASSQPIDQSEAPASDPTTDDEAPIAEVVACRAWMATEKRERGPSESPLSPRATSDLLARLPALCACPTPASESTSTALGMLLERRASLSTTQARLPVGPGLASSAGPDRTVTERQLREAQERHDERVAWATHLWAGAAVELVRLAADELDATRRGGQLPPEEQHRLSDLCTQAARARPRRHRPR